MHLTVGKLSIDVIHQLDHVARGGFLRVLIAGEIALHMAKGALLTEGCPECAHRGANVGIRRQHLQILRRAHAFFLGRILWRRSQQ